MLNRLLLISLEVCLNLVLVNIRLLDYYQQRFGGETDKNMTNYLTSLGKKVQCTLFIICSFKLQPMQCFVLCRGSIIKYLCLVFQILLFSGFIANFKYFVEI